ncbi:aldehyde dehydrogenase [Mycobacterium sp.]|uniref:aldehyde dehydrogenase n=1 Tax=Mycobacterium sp. TaxID=1785 RepID=UPI002BAAA093|nr:aldehyde dehydrogenase [Mycobacterium sp.]HKP40895.1 aldehyde dehydrogenase [Mycobacterium sp.]
MTMRETLIESNELFIAGGWRQPRGGNRIEVYSASTEELIGSVPEGVEADADDAVAAARTAFEDPSGWSSWSPTDRAKALDRLADALVARREAIARRVSMQNGMPIGVSTQIEGNIPVMVCRYYAELARSHRFSEDREGLLGGVIEVTQKPVGVVVAIVPWNFPVSLMFGKVAPLLAAGCTAVIKPSPETVLDSLEVAEAIIEAGIPAGVLNIVPGGRELGAYLVEHPGVDKVAFTGSTAAGRRIAERCGTLLRPVTLELGGKSAAIILDDADLTQSLEQLFLATLLNNGQTCFIGTRVLAPMSRYEDVLQTFAGLVGALQVGDALDPSTQIGPMVSAVHRDRVQRYIDKGKAEGATVVVGGGPPEQQRGWFVQPTVFASVDNSATIAREEIFGPVLSVIAYETVEDALAIANDSEYGLGGSVWSSNPEKAQKVARRVQTGTVGINHYTLDPAAPFGGIKASGIGRELGPEGLQAYLSIQSMFKTAPAPAGPS